MDFLDRCRVCDGLIIKSDARQRIRLLQRPLGFFIDVHRTPNRLRNQYPNIQWEIDLSPEFEICFCRRDVVDAVPSEAGQ